MKIRKCLVMGILLLLAANLSGTGISSERVVPEMIEEEYEKTVVEWDGEVDEKMLYSTEGYRSFERWVLFEDPDENTLELRHGNDTLAEDTVNVTEREGVENITVSNLEVEPAEGDDFGFAPAEMMITADIEHVDPFDALSRSVTLEIESEPPGSEIETWELDPGESKSIEVEHQVRYDDIYNIILAEESESVEVGVGRDVEVEEFSLRDAFETMTGVMDARVKNTADMERTVRMGIYDMDDLSIIHVEDWTLEPREVKDIHYRHNFEEEGYYYFVLVREEEPFWLTGDETGNSLEDRCYGEENFSGVKTGEQEGVVVEDFYTPDELPLNRLGAVSGEITNYNENKEVVSLYLVGPEDDERHIRDVVIPPFGNITRYEHQFYYEIDSGITPEEMVIELEGDAEKYRYRYITIQRPEGDDKDELTIEDQLLDDRIGGFDETISVEHDYKIRDNVYSQVQHYLRTEHNKTDIPDMSEVCITETLFSKADEDWLDDPEPLEGEYEIVVNLDGIESKLEEGRVTFYEPVVELKTFELTVDVAEGEGDLYVDHEQVDPGHTEEFEEGTEVHLAAEPIQSHKFDHWQVNDETFDEESIIIEMDDNKTAYAHFEEEDIAYEISDWEDLHNMRYDLEGDYTLMNDLDEGTDGYDELVETEKGWEPIGEYDEEEDVEFTGTFDGNGHEIRDLYINRPDEDHVGLFGATDGGAEITDLNVVDAEVNGNLTVGIMVGLNWDGTVKNCFSSGYVNGNGGVAGLVGGNHHEGHVENSSASVDVNGVAVIGGIIGLNSGSVKSCYSTGSVNGEAYIGGMSGAVEEGVLENTYSLSDVSGEEKVGGLVGQVGYGDYHEGGVLNSYSVGDVSGDDEQTVGGLVGLIEGGNVTDSFWDIETSGIEESDGGTGKTTAEMKDIATYTDTDTEGLEVPWDFVGDPYDDEGDKDTWDIDIDGITNEGYPFLAWEEEQGEYELNIHIEGKGSVDIKGLEVGDGWSGVFEEGETVELAALPDEGWYFEEWTGDHGDAEERITVTMDDNKEITAHFKVYYELLTEVEGEGSVERAPDQKEYEEGTDVTLEAIAAESWKFIEWTGDHESTDEEITVIMDSDKEITAHFEEYEPAYFEIEILEYDEEVMEGEDITVTYKVTNTGEFEGTQDIVLHLNGEEVEVYSELELGPNDEYEDEFTIEASEVGEQTLLISSADMSEFAVTTVEEEEPEDSFFSSYWWIIPLILIVLVAIVLLFMMKGKEEAEEDPLEEEFEEEL